MQKSAATLPSGFTSLVLTADFMRVAPNDQQAVEAFIQKRHGFFGASHVIFAETGRLNDTVTTLLAEHQKPVVITSAYAPFTDFSALNEAAAHSGAVTFSGMVPGTEIIEYRPVSEGVSAKVTLGTQAQYGSQLNLRKYKRLKVFLAAIHKWPDMAEMHIADLMAHLKENQPFFLNYAVEAPLVHHKVCPHCKHDGFTPLPATYSQALTGYTVSGTTAYFECQACGLIVMSPHISPEYFKEFYDAYDAADMFFDEEDILQGSPRHNHQIVLDKLPSLLPQRTPPDPITALDIGGGPGLYSAALKRAYPDWRVVHGDFETRSNSILEKAGVEARHIVLPSQSLGNCEFDVVSAFEVIEHFDYEGFKALINTVKAALKPGGIFVCTTPDFDSPMLQAFDWFNIGLPHHPIIFRRSWLKHYIASAHPDFELVFETGGDDFMRDREGYFSYFQETASSVQASATAALMAHMLRDEKLVEKLRANFMQTEVILFFQKNGSERGLNAE